MKNKITTKNLVILSLLIALHIILSRFTKVSIPPFNRVTFGYMATAITAVLFGPWYTALASGIADIIGVTLFPTDGAFFPGFTITAIVGGFIYGKAFYKNSLSVTRVVVANILVITVCHLLLNSLWFSMLSGKAFAVILLPKIIKNLIMFPIESSIIFVTIKYLSAPLKSIVADPQ